MEREFQFFKSAEEKPVEIPEGKPEEIAAPEPEKKEREFVLAETEAEDKFKAELTAKEKAEKEKGEFLDKIQKDEQEMAGGILRKFTEAPKNVKRGLMILAVAGVILSASKAFAGGEQLQRTHQGWQSTTRQVERLPYQYGARESQKMEAIQHQYQLKERARFEAYRDYQQQAESLQKTYEQRKFDIMIGRVEGATDYSGKQRAYQELEQWRQSELNRLRYEWSLKVWAAEEEYRQKVYQIQQWR